MKKFILEIDPRTKSISKVEFNEEFVGLETLYKSLECDYVDRVVLNDTLDLWVDDEGLINNASERIGYFNVGDNEAYQFVGKGLICGYTQEGENIPIEEDEADWVIKNLTLTF